MLKTTQSGYEGYHIDKFTKLPETRERILATAIDCVWSYDTNDNGRGDTSKRKGWFGSNNHNANTIDYDVVYQRVLENIKDQFFGDAQRGVYSPSVQATLYDMGNAIVNNIRGSERREIYVTKHSFYTDLTKRSRSQIRRRRVRSHLGAARYHSRDGIEKERNA